MPIVELHPPLRRKTGVLDLERGLDVYSALDGIHHADRPPNSQSGCCSMRLSMTRDGTLKCERLPLHRRPSSGCTFISVSLQAYFAQVPELAL